jgi:hypothetical protein
MLKGREYIDLWFNEPKDHPYYVTGHVQKDEAQHVLDSHECEMSVKSIKHRYGRLVRVGPDHEDAIDGLDTVFRVIDAPRRSYYKVTECEPLLPFNAESSTPQGVTRTPG